MPETYAPDRRAEIMGIVVASLGEGKPLAEICREPGMPDRVTIYRWRDEDAEFAQHIARAREAGFDAIAEDCLDIADETGRDTKYGKDGQESPDGEWIARSRLRVETRLKLLAKWDPKRYGDKVDVNHGGQAGNPIESKMEATIRFIRPGDVKDED